MREFIGHGFRKFLILNHHYENTGVLPEGVERAIEESGKENVKAVIMRPSFMITSEALSKIYVGPFPGLAVEHAALLETSLMLFLRPDLVRSTKIPDERVERIVIYEIIPPPADIMTESGSLWSAAAASKEKGQFLFNTIVENLLKTVSRELSIKL